VQQSDVRAAWARPVALAASWICGLYLLAVLGFGAWWVSTSGELACFGDDPASCPAPDEAYVGLGVIQASSWVLGAVALAAAVGAIVLALRLRRAAQVVPVLALCAASVVIAQVLWARV
jgi:hypothetical protein